MDGFGVSQEARFAGALEAFGPALERLARGYEEDAAERRDLLQNIHLALWRSFAGFAEKCSLRTWVFRVAHNVGATHALRRTRQKRVMLATLGELAELPAPGDPEQAVAGRDMLAQLLRVIRGLKPPDAQIMLLYLEDFSAAEIGEVTGLSAGAVATRIHRVRAVLERHMKEGGRDHG